MKRGTYRQVYFTIEPAGRGGYYIESHYKGVNIRVFTTDSLAYDWVDDDSDKEKFAYARRYCYRRIHDAYEVQKPQKQKLKL